MEPSNSDQSTVEPEIGIVNILGSLCRFQQGIDQQRLYSLIRNNKFLEFTVNPYPGTYLKTDKLYGQSSHRAQKGALDDVLQRVLRLKMFRGRPTIYIYECGKNGLLHVHGFMLVKEELNEEKAKFQFAVHSKLGKSYLRHNICCMCTYANDWSQRKRWLNYMTKNDETRTSYEPKTIAMPMVS